MKYARTMYLLSILYSTANEEQRNRLGHLFQQAVTENEQYQHMMQLLQNTTMLGTHGKHLHDEGEAACQDTITQIDRAGVNLSRLEEQTAVLERELEESQALLESPGFFKEVISVLPTKDVHRYREFYEDMANAIVFYLLSEFGPDSIRALHYNPEAGLQEEIQLVNYSYSAALRAASDFSKPLVWYIHAARIKDIIEFPGYELQYSNKTLKTVVETMPGNHYHQIALNVYASDQAGARVPIIGEGFICGVSPMDAVSALGASIITGLPQDVFGTGTFNPLRVLDQMEESLGSRMYCVPAQDLVRVMNRQSMNVTSQTRVKHRQCIFCGRDVAHGLYCDKHFPTDR